MRPRLAELEAAESSPGSEMYRAKAVAIIGIAVTLVGVVLYCVASLNAGRDADLGEVMFQGASPSTLIALCVMGIGTLLWLFGSLIHLGAAMGEESGPDPS